MLDKYFFDVPVYRLSEKKYYSQRSKYIEKEMYRGAPEDAKEMQEFHKKYPGNKISFEKCLIKDYGGPWIYNEIIGFIRLYFCGSQIRGEYYRVASKRITKTRKKQFEFKSWKLANEIDIPEKSDNNKIFALIIEYINNCKKELEKRYIDISLLKVLGPHVDWIALLKS